MYAPSRTPPALALSTVDVLFLYIAINMIIKNLQCSSGASTTTTTTTTLQFIHFHHIMFVPYLRCTVQLSVYALPHRKRLYKNESEDKTKCFFIVHEVRFTSLKARF